MKIGLIVNPIAGMGGKVGLKGTDGKEILEKARLLGAIEESPVKARKALEPLLEIKDDLKIYTGPNNMGENIARELGFEIEVVGDKKEETSPEDTIEIAKKILEKEIDILMFAGGDGTARNIFTAVGDKVPVIGIPAGVKIHSGVFASYPKGAGEVVIKFLKDETDIKEMEVMDIDESKFREGQVMAKLFGYMKIPFQQELVQVQKSGGIEGEEGAIDGITDRIIDDMEEDIYYIIGSGTTTRPIMEKLGLKNTLLGIDIIKNKELIKNDANEKEILEIIKGKNAKIVVTAIGGQGYIFGRGNQQISKDVVKEVGINNIKIIATKRKLMSLENRPLLVDLGDEEINKLFNGYRLVRTNYTDESVHMLKGL